jgi:hypothetical protein
VEDRERQEISETEESPEEVEGHGGFNPAEREAVKPEDDDDVEGHGGFNPSKVDVS